MERAVILESGEEVRPASLPDFEVESRLRQGDGTGPDAPIRTGTLSDALIQFESELILSAFQRCSGNLAKAAQHLGISRHALRYRISRLNLDVEGDVDDTPEERTT
jgi:DNA-binding NtrC family response regulator